jgi:hypothetical protein
MRWWPEPTAGEIVWCHFPDNIHPKPKPRLGLIISTKIDDEENFFVSVSYGTSQKTNRLYSGEFLISGKRVISLLIPIFLIPAILSEGSPHNILTNVTFSIRISS